MAHISIIGTGNMGQALAGRFGQGGHDVELLGSGDAERQPAGEIVVLAVPYSAVGSILEQRGAELAGKTVVDLTNPVNLETFDSLVVPADSSAAAEIARRLPESHVVKAFNTNFAGTLVSGTVGDAVPTTVLVAGDDPQAKSELIGAVSSSGLRVIDAGALSRARELEALGFLQIGLAANERISWTGGFGVVA
jgi:predicted dinucleotide-binding enzyme